MVTVGDGVSVEPSSRMKTDEGCKLTLAVDLGWNFTHLKDAFRTREKNREIRDPIKNYTGSLQSTGGFRMNEKINGPLFDLNIYGLCLFRSLRTRWSTRQRRMWSRRALSSKAVRVRAVRKTTQPRYKKDRL